jgi:short-subunit dehydrogenase
MELTMTKTALITGASTGIGHELSKIFAKKGYDLVLVARDGQRLAKIATKLESQYGITATTMAKDLSQPSAPGDIYNTVVDEKIGIDVLVNNAGSGHYGRFIDTDLRKIQDEIQLNITTLTTLCRLFGADMVKKGAGSILNVSSTAAFQPGPLMGNYYASKGYVLMLSEALNYELKGDGVTITVLCPGPTQTEFFKRSNMTETNLARGPWVMSAADVAQAGFDGLMKGKTIVIPGMINKLIVFLIRFTPRRLAPAIVSFLHKK